jgi:hypothetical protein
VDEDNGFDAVLDAGFGEVDVAGEQLAAVGDGDLSVHFRARVFTLVFRPVPELDRGHAAECGCGVGSARRRAGAVQGFDDNRDRDAPSQGRGERVDDRRTGLGGVRDEDGSCSAG